MSDKQPRKKIIVTYWPKGSRIRVVDASSTEENTEQGSSVRTPVSPAESGDEAESKNKNDSEDKTKSSEKTKSNGNETQSPRSTTLARLFRTPLPTSRTFTPINSNGGQGTSSASSSSRMNLRSAQGGQTATPSKAEPKKGEMENQQQPSRAVNGQRDTAASKQKKRYPCKYAQKLNCDKTFTTSGHASRHSKIHLGVKNILCEYPGCTKKFTRNDNMKQHYKTHFRNETNQTGTTTRSARASITVNSRRASTDSSVTQTTTTSRVSSGSLAPSTTPGSVLPTPRISNPLRTASPSSPSTALTSPASFHSPLVRPSQRSHSSGNVNDNDNKEYFPKLYGDIPPERRLPAISEIQRPGSWTTALPPLRIPEGRPGQPPQLVQGHGYHGYYGYQPREPEPAHGYIGFRPREPENWQPVGWGTPAFLLTQTQRARSPSPSDRLLTVPDRLRHLMPVNRPANGLDMLIAACEEVNQMRKREWGEESGGEDNNEDNGDENQRGKRRKMNGEAADKDKQPEWNNDSDGDIVMS